MRSSPEDACRPCGRDPEFNIEFLPPGGPIEVIVTAIDAVGRESSVSTVAEHAEEVSPLDVQPGAEPLRVRREGPTDFRFTWSLAAGSGYALYSGVLDALWQTGELAVGGFSACDLGTPEWSGAPPAGSAYFLVTSGCNFGDASLGRDSTGKQRPGAAPRCP